MKIMGVSGSPRRGNTEWMVQTVLEAASLAGAETEHFILRRADIKPCRGCMACEAPDDTAPGVCRIKDDMADILPRYLDTDIIVMGTPVYFSMVSGLLKKFMDRTCPVWQMLKGKKLAGIAVAEGSIGAAIRNLHTYCDLCGMEWAGGVTTLARNPKDASKDRALKKRLQRLGRNLAKA